MKKINLISYFFIFNIAALTISDSGPFALGGDIADIGDIITIAVDDVTLDMSNQTISGGTNGIVINSGLSNITIQNGVISNLTGTGIIINQNCENIRIENILTFSCDSRGIDFAGSSGNQISSCLLKNCEIQNCCRGTNSDYALVLTECIKTEVIKCKINCNGISTQPLSVFRLDNCSDCICKQVTLNNNTGSTVVGMELLAPLRNSFTNCILKNNSSISGIFTGCNMSGSSNTLNEFIECDFSGNSASTIFTGYNLEANSTGNFFSLCKIRRNSGGPISGFNLNGGGANNNDNIFTNCTVSNHTVSGATSFDGFLINGSDFGIIHQCLISQNSSSSSTSSGITFITNGGDNWEIRSNRLVRNIGSSNANSFGIRIVVGTNNLNIRNIAWNNGTGAAGSQLPGIPGGSTTTRQESNLNARDEPWTNYAIR